MEKYPAISLTELEKIKNVVEQAENDPKYLDGRIAPYDRKTRELLKSFIPDPVAAATIEPGAQKGKVGRPKKNGMISMTELEKEFDELRGYINDLKKNVKGLEPHEQIQVVKTHAALIEKILSMKERISNINKVDKFMATVIEMMEAELPQESRLRVIEKLDEYKTEE
tara:strand:- start:11777 stop:12280 length:504 start_codon:yes stop_codon:yes gene_type:complete